MQYFLMIELQYDFFFSQPSSSGIVCKICVSNLISAPLPPRSRSSGCYSVNPPQGDTGEQVARGGGQGEYTLLDKVGSRGWVEEKVEMEKI